MCVYIHLKAKKMKMKIYFKSNQDLPLHKDN